MNYFIEGLQGSGKSTLVRKLSELHSDYTAVREGEYSPVELSWCAYMDETAYHGILEKYPDLRQSIEEKTVSEGDRKIICYTKIWNNMKYITIVFHMMISNPSSFHDTGHVIRTT